VNETRVILHVCEDLVSRRNRVTLDLSIPRDPAGLVTTGRRAAAVVASELGESVVVTLNGVPTTVGELADRDLSEGDVIVAAPRPRGPETLATIAIQLALAAIFTGVSMLLTPRQKLPRPDTGEEAQRRYTFARFSSQAFVGDPIPVVLGRQRRMGWKEIYAEPVDSTDGSGVSSIRMLLCGGRGEIQSAGSLTSAVDGVASESVTGIYLEDQPIAEFPGCRVWYRPGTEDQRAIPGFDDIKFVRDVGVGGAVLRNTSGAERTGPSPSAEAVSFTTVEPVNDLTIRVRLTQGLYSLNNSGSIDARRVRYRVRTRRVGSGSGGWSAWRVITLERAEQSPFVSAPVLESLDTSGAGDRFDIEVERVSPESGATTDADTLEWEQVVETRRSTLRYPGLAMLAIEVVASERLQGKPRVSIDTKGLKTLRIWDGVSTPTAPVFTTGYSENPAWYLLALLTDPVWGMGATYADADIDFASLFAWAAYGDELVSRYPGAGGVDRGTHPRFRSHFVLGQSATQDGLEAIQSIADSGRCVAISSGRLWRFVVDRPRETPAEVFSDATIAAGTIRYTRADRTGPAGQANQLTAQFEREDRDGQAEVLTFPQVGELWLGGSSPETPRPDSVRIQGVTDADQVLREMVYRMKRSRFLTRSIRFQTAKVYPECLPGDRIDVAVDLVGWGVASGRVLAATASSVTIDRTVTLETGRAYVVQIVHPGGATEVRPLGPVGGITVISAGTPVAIVGTWARTPDAFAEYAIGQEGVSAKPFVATAVRCVDAQAKSWEIEAVEYAAGVYDPEPGVVTLPQYSGLGSLFTAPGPVINLTARDVRLPGGATRITLSWGQRPADAAITKEFRIYRRRVGGSTWVLTPSTTPTTRGADVEIAEANFSYEFVVVAVSQTGAALSPDDPRHPRVSVSAGLGELPPPPPSPVLATQIGGAGGPWVLSWDPVEGAVGYQVITPGADLTSSDAGRVHAMVAGRTTATEYELGVLAPGVATTVYVRSFNASGRLSWTATRVAIAPSVPTGRTVRSNVVAAVGASGVTLANATARSVGGFSAWVPADVTAEAVVTLPEVDLGPAALSQVHVLPASRNATTDPVLADFRLAIPSIEADQWAVVALAPAAIAMHMPPFPDDRHRYVYELRVHDGTGYGPWRAVGVGAVVSGLVAKYQVRARMSVGPGPSGAAGATGVPYAPGLRQIRAVVTA
jgi:hypothetical protein